MIKLNRKINYHKLELYCFNVDKIKILIPILTIFLKESMKTTLTQKTWKCQKL